MMTHRLGFGRWIALIAVLSTLLLAVAGCGSASSSSSSAAGASSTVTNGQIEHAKAKFVLHAGLAFGAFHRWISQPAKAGDFAHPLSHKLALLDAALAGTFVYHELKLALQDAQADPTLSKLVSPITALQNKVSGLSSNIKAGNASPATVNDANGTIASIKQQSASAGQPITEQVPSQP
jgi:hypothetical protein